MIFSQSSFIYFNYSLQEAIHRLHQFGYQGIEVWGGRPHAYRHDLDDQLDEIRQLLDHFEMIVPNFVPAQFRYPSILCSLNERVREDSVGYIQDAINNAQQTRRAVCESLPRDDALWRESRPGLGSIAEELR